MLPVGRGYKFKLKPENETQINPRYLVYYMLLWIAYIDNHYNIYYVLKAKHSRYPKRIK